MARGPEDEGERFVEEVDEAVDESVVYRGAVGYGLGE